MDEVAIAGLPLDYPHSGTAVYLRHLLDRLPVAAPDLRFQLYLRQAVTDLLPHNQTRIRTPLRRVNRGSGPGARLDKLVWEIGSFPLAAAHRRATLLHLPYFAAPLAASAPFVVTVHDVIPLILPGYHRGRASQVYARFMAATVRRAAAIITVSQHSRRDILRVLDVPPEKVFVTPEAADESCRPEAEPGEAERLRQTYALPERYFLYLGSAEKRKNIATLIEAWAMVQHDMKQQGIKLVVVARFPPPDALYPDIPALARQLGCGETVQFLESVTPADKPALYRQALAFCFPSLYEGFGLPPLEAMACGTAVLCSSATSLPEAVGDGAWLLEPQAPEAWADAMVTLAGNEAERRVWVERGMVRASELSWNDTAALTADVYRVVVSR